MINIDKIDTLTFSIRNLVEAAETPGTPQRIQNEIYRTVSKLNEEILSNFQKPTYLSEATAGYLLDTINLLDSMILSGETHTNRSMTSLHYARSTLKAFIKDTNTPKATVLTRRSTSDYPRDLTENEDAETSGYRENEYQTKIKNNSGFTNKNSGIRFSQLNERIPRLSGI